MYLFRLALIGLLLIVFAVSQASASGGYSIQQQQVIKQRVRVQRQPIIRHRQRVVVQQQVAYPVVQQQVVQKVYAQPVVQRVYAQPVVQQVVQPYCAPQAVIQQQNTCQGFFAP